MTKFPYVRVLHIVVYVVLGVACGRSAQTSPENQLQGERTLIALMEAAKKGDLASVKRSLASGADVNAGDANGYTPLQYAAAHRRHEWLDGRSGTTASPRSEPNNS